MQYCPLGNMGQFLKTNPDTNRIDLVRSLDFGSYIPCAECTMQCYDIVTGIVYLHNKGIVHADLKGVRFPSKVFDD